MIEIDEKEHAALIADQTKNLNQIEKLKCQLEACGMAAQGIFTELPRTAYGWSPEFERVRKLRRMYEAYNAERQP
jgi:hypothetical protein